MTPTTDHRKKVFSDYLLHALVGFIGIVLTVGLNAGINAMHSMSEEIRQLREEVSAVKVEICDARTDQAGLQGELCELRKEFVAHMQDDRKRGR